MVGVLPAVARFMLGSLAAIAVVVVGGYFALRQVALDEAERDTRERVQADGARRRGRRRSPTASLRGEPARARSGSTTSCSARCSAARSCA